MTRVAFYPSGSTGPYLIGPIPPKSVSGFAASLFELRYYMSKHGNSSGLSCKKIRGSEPTSKAAS